MPVLIGFVVGFVPTFAVAALLALLHLRPEGLVLGAVVGVSGVLRYWDGLR